MRNSDALMRNPEWSSMRHRLLLEIDSGNIRCGPAAPRVALWRADRVGLTHHEKRALRGDLADCWIWQRFWKSKPGEWMTETTLVGTMVKARWNLDHPEIAQEFAQGLR